MTGIVALIFAEIIWGMSPPIFKYALEGVPPFTLATIRFMGAALLFLPFALPHISRITGRQLWFIIWGGIVGVGVHISVFFLGLQYAPSINVHMIGSLAPMILYVLSIMILHERPHTQVLHGMLVAFVGVFIIFFAPVFGGTSIAGEHVPDIVLGNALFFIAVLATVGHTIFNKKIVREVHPAALMSVQFFFGSLVFLPFVPGELQTWSLAQLDSRGIIGILFGMFVASAGAYFFLNQAMKTISAQTVGIYSYIKPIVAVLVAVPLLGEIPNTAFVIGAILIFLGVYIAEAHPHYHHVRRRVHEK